MNILKLLGSTMLIFSGFSVYFEIQKSENRKIKQINAYISLIEYIKKQIECFLLPIDSILCSCDEHIIRECIGSDSDEIESLDELFAATSFCIDAEAVAHISSFVRDFGSYYREGQIRACEICRDELSKISRTMCENTAKNKRVILTLCLCASLSVILMLI